MELRDRMQQIALEWPAYGYRRITHEPQEQGFDVNHKRVPRMMREDNKRLKGMDPRGRNGGKDDE